MSSPHKHSTSPATTTTSSSLAQQQPPPYQVIYDTFCICPICSFVEKAKLNWIPGSVIHKDGQVWFIIKCAKHGDQEVLYCSDVNFFLSCLKYSPGVMENITKKVLDVEEIHKRVTYNQPELNNTPLVIDVSLYHQQQQFVSDEKLIELVKNAHAVIPPSKNFVLRVSGKLVVNMNTLNSKVNTLLQNFNKNIVLLELTFDRVLLLSKIPNSVLLNNLIYPSVQIFIQKGDEDNNLRDLTKSLEALKGITNLQIVVSLVLSRPFPRIDGILALLRTMKGIIRFIMIDVERPPSAIMKQFEVPKEHFVKSDSLNVDPVELLKHIQASTKGEIAMSDFFPTSVGMILEPFLNLLGYGNYNIRPSPFCGFATCLVNTETFKSVPASRLIDIPKLFESMIPVVQTLQKQKEQSISLFTAQALKKAITNCVQKGAKLPDLWSYISATDEQKVKQTRKVFGDVQFLVIHNQMDVGVVDAVRRTRCSVCSQSPNSKNLVAACTSGCI